MTLLDGMNVSTIHPRVSRCFSQSCSVSETYDQHDRVKEPHSRSEDTTWIHAPDGAFITASPHADDAPVFWGDRTAAELDPLQGDTPAASWPISHHPPGPGRSDSSVNLERLTTDRMTRRAQQLIRPQRPGDLGTSERWLGLW